MKLKEKNIWNLIYIKLFTVPWRQNRREASAVVHLVATLLSLNKLILKNEMKKLLLLLHFAHSCFTETAVAGLAPSMVGYHSGKNKNCIQTYKKIGLMVEWTIDEQHWLPKAALYSNLYSYYIT